MKIAVLIGTRPEIIMMCPVIGELASKRVDYFIIHTGQHYSYNLDEVFFEQLQIPSPDYNLGVGSWSQATQTAKILVGVEEVLDKETTDVLLVEGDTNSVLAGALAASKLGIEVGHVEAELRSYDKCMPEEINRILTDHCSDYLFAPTENAQKILVSEGISAEEKERLSLPILIEITPGQNDIGIMAGGQSIEAKVLSEVVGMPVADDKGNIKTCKSQLGEIRSKLKTTTQYLFSAKGL